MINIHPYKPSTDGSNMHDNRIILFFIETSKYGVYYSAVNVIYLYKVPITWISLYFLLTKILVYL